MFKLHDRKISITRGDTGRFRIDVSDEYGDVYDYNGENVTVLFTVKENTSAKKILIQKRVFYGYDVVIEPADTSKMPYGRYVYDVQLKNKNGDVYTVIPPNTFRVLPEVTFDG